MTKKLFEPISYGSFTAKNRFVKAATYEQRGTFDGFVTDALVKVYSDLADGGVGTILTGFAYVSPNEQPTRRMIGACDDKFIPGLSRLADVAHEKGSKILLQLVYGGTMSANNKDNSVWGPSRVTNHKTGLTSIEMSYDDLATLRDDFAMAALRAKKAGFDGVELHAAHGYLLSQFLSPDYNLRNDEYGGSIENRVRFINETAAAIREKTGADFDIWIKLNSSDSREGGLTEEDSMAAIKLMEDRFDAFEISGSFNRYSLRGDKPDHAFFAPFAAAASKEIRTPVILTGGNRKAPVLEEILNSSSISAFGLARPLVCEPELINKWETDPKYFPACIACGGCFSNPDAICAIRK